MISQSEFDCVWNKNHLEFSANEKIDPMLTWPICDIIFLCMYITILERRVIQQKPHRSTDRLCEVHD